MTAIFSHFPPGIATYQKAKEWLQDAVVIWQWSSPCLVETRYRKPDGSVWAESESLLESPYDDYSLTRLS